MSKLKSWILHLQKYADRWWYAPLVGLLAFLDLFVVVIPTDGLLVSAAMLAPRRWIYSAVCTAVGSSVGAWLLAVLLQQHGLPLLLSIKPGIDQSSLWLWTHNLMESWGGWGVFFIALSPLMQHPAVALAAVGGMVHTQIFLYVLGGRMLKYLFLAWLSTHAPGVLKKLWGIQGELEEAGIKSPEKPLK